MSRIALIGTVIVVAALAIASAACGQAVLVSGPYLVAAADGHQREQVICYNHERDEYLVAYFDHKSSYGVPGIAAWRLDAYGYRIGNELIVKPGDIGAGVPCVAYNSVNDEYLVTFGDWNGYLWGQRIDAATGAFIGGNYLIDYSVALEPVLSYSPNSNTYCLAWRDDRIGGLHDVYARILDGATGAPICFRNVTDFTDGFAGLPGIAYNSDLDQFFITLQIEVVADRADIYARRLDAATGTFVGSPAQLTYTDTITEAKAAIDYDSDMDRFLLLYEHWGATVDVRGQFLAADGSLIGGWFGVVEEPYHGGLPGIAWHPRSNEFLAVWLDATTPSNYCRRISQTGELIGEPSRTNGWVYGFGNWPTAPAVNLGPGAHDYIVCWQNNYTDVYTVRATLRNFVSSDKPDGTYGEGEVIDIQVRFDRPVTVTGTPQLALNASPGLKADYFSGSDTTTPTFRYTAQQGDSTPDLDYTATTALTLNGGTIKDASGNDVDLTLTLPGTRGSLGYNKDIVIDAIPPTTTADPQGGVYGGPVAVTLTPSRPAAVYYTTDGSTPTTSSPVYSSPIQISADTTLRFFAVDSVGNHESPKKQEDYAILSDDGAIAAAKLLPDDDPVRLGDKAMYLKWGTFGYIQESDRTTGVRVEGAVTADEGDLVRLTGTIKTRAGGERYILVDAITPCGTYSCAPLGANNAAAASALADGLFITVWGRVLPGSIGGDSYLITDGSNQSLRIVTAGAPGVSENEFVIVSGAAGYDESGRVVFNE